MHAETTVAVAFPNHRGVPLAGIPPFVEALERTGAVDQFWVWDELTGWAPEGLGTLAPGLDAHSTHDPFIECAVAVAASPRIGVRMTTDAVRSRPAELTRTLLSLASATEGKVVCSVGLGEARHLVPFGHPTGQGLSRLEDLLYLTHELLEADAPFSYEGRRWSFDSSFIGTYRPRKPEIWALGGGPKFTQIATKLADGIEAAHPQAVAGVSVFAERAVDIRRQVEEHGRDPDAFGIGVWIAAALHEDPDVIDLACKNPLLQWYAAAYGRMNQNQWEAEGLHSVMPPGWHYGNDFFPFTMTAAEAQAYAAKVPEEMVRKSAAFGTVEEVAELAHEFIDAGATFVGLLDVMPLHTGAAGMPDSTRRLLELATRIKTPAVAR